MTDKAKDRISQLFADGTEIDRALERGVREALWRHRQLGVPIVVWRDGQIVWVPPEEIVVPPEVSAGSEPSAGPPVPG
jgi:hypothetical protein